MPKILTRALYMARRLGYTRDTLARNVLEMSRWTLWRIEQGKRELTPPERKRLATFVRNRGGLLVLLVALASCGRITAPLEPCGRRLVGQVVSATDPTHVLALIYEPVWFGCDGVSDLGDSTAVR